jgi:hypothetical protein
LDDFLGDSLDVFFASWIVWIMILRLFGWLQQVTTNPKIN